MNSLAARLTPWPGVGFVCTGWSVHSLSPNRSTITHENAKKSIESRLYRNVLSPNADSMSITVSKISSLDKRVKTAGDISTDVDDEDLATMLLRKALRRSTTKIGIVARVVAVGRIRNVSQADYFLNHFHPLGTEDKAVCVEMLFESIQYASMQTPDTLGGTLYKPADRALYFAYNDFFARFNDSQSSSQTSSTSQSASFPTVIGETFFRRCLADPSLRSVFPGNLYEGAPKSSVVIVLGNQANSAPLPQSVTLVKSDNTNGKKKKANMNRIRMSTGNRQTSGIKPYDIKRYNE